MIPEPTSILWRQVAFAMAEKWPETNEDQMDRLGQAWNRAGEAFVFHGQPRDEPPKSVWGDVTGDAARRQAANQRNSAKTSGEDMLKFGRNAGVFGSDVKYTKESISQYVESYDSMYWFLLIADAISGGAGGRGGGRVPGRPGMGGGGGGADVLVEGLAAENDAFIQTMAARITSYGANQKKLPRAEYPDTEPGYTPQSGAPDPAALPHGTPTPVPPETQGMTDEQRENARGLRRENEAAVTLAQQGFDVEQNPAAKPNGHKPDYLVEGKYFDAYSPMSDDPRTLRGQVEQKVMEGQVDRVVINFADSSVDPQVVRDDLRRNQVEGLQEVVGIDENGTLIPLYP
jgi:hypothetical protein